MNMSLSYLEQAFHVSPFAIITTLVAVILGVLYLSLKDRGLPPGPVGLPLVGYWPFLKDETIGLQLQGLTKKYGDVFSFRVAGTLFIHLGSIKAIKEAHVAKSDFFAHRYTGYSAVSITFGKGIVTRNGEEWKVIRKFFVQAFREYGLTSVKDYMTGSIYDSVNATVNDLKKTDGSPFHIDPILKSRSLAIFRRMMFNDNEVTEKEIQDILNVYGKLFAIFVGKRKLLIGDFAKKFLFPRIEGFENTLQNVTMLKDHIKKIIRMHESTFDRDNIRDLIDSYIKERKDRSNRGDPTAEYFSEEGLVGSLIEFVGDGILSVAGFICFFIRALLEHPEEQEKIYQELMDVVGSDRGVTLEDRNNLPYTNAFLQEVLRTTDMFTYLPSLECTKETTLNGYKIPVGAVTVVNFWTSQRDPKLFDEPDVFKPSRYLPEKGKPKAESPILFGIGKRSCVGESYTMMQVFLFLTTIVKSFRLAPSEEGVMKFNADGHKENMEVCAHPRK